MNTETYSFKVGTFECVAVSDGTLIYRPEDATYSYIYDSDYYFPPNILMIIAIGWILLGSVACAALSLSKS